MCTVRFAYIAPYGGASKRPHTHRDMAAKQPVQPWADLSTVSASRTSAVAVRVPQVCGHSQGGAASGSGGDGDGAGWQEWYNPSLAGGVLADQC